MKKLLVSVIALFGAVSLSAQDVTAIYNEAAAAFGAKNFTEAAAKFEQVIDQGMDNESAASMVATAKSTLPKCYFMLGGGALKTKNYDEALKNFEKSAELAELYGDMNQMAKSNGWVAKIYQIQGGDAFNNKDYATASEINLERNIIFCTAWNFVNIITARCYKLPILNILNGYYLVSSNRFICFRFEWKSRLNFKPITKRFYFPIFWYIFSQLLIPNHFTTA